jgi:tetratricopeptide (TPR) repeat protein
LESLAPAAAGPNALAAGVPGLFPRAPKPAPVSQASAREALRNASAGVRLVKEGRVDEGIALLKRSILLNPDAATAQHDLGVALLAARRMEEAIEPFGAALRLRPGYASAHHALAQIFDALDQQAKAMAS